MKKLLILFLLLSPPCFISDAVAGPPARIYTYTSGTTILSAHVTANEDAVFDYLTAGVDTYADGTILNADISATADIDETKVDLSTISQNTTFTGTLDFSGATITAQTTFADLVATTADINGGTIDDVTIGGVSAGVATFTSITMTNAVTEFSTDGTLAGDSDTAIPTEKATKTYVDAMLSTTSYTSNDTWTCPAGVTRVYITMAGGGGGGGGGENGQYGGGGGGGGAYTIDTPHTVVPTTGYAVEVGAGGAGGGAGLDGSAGGETRFDTLYVKGGSGGSAGKSAGSVADGPGGTGGTTYNTGGTKTATVGGGIPGFAGGAGADGDGSGYLGGGGGSSLSVGATGADGGGGAASGSAGVTGSGGSGGANAGSGGAGGTGIVIVQYVL